MKEDKRVQVAAHVAYFFKIDPVEVLNVSYMVWALRLAAYEIAVKAKNDAIEEARKNQKKPRLR